MGSTRKGTSSNSSIPIPISDFILVGDSGQKDVEIYAEVVRDYPDRIRACYIRDVTPEDRDDEVRRLAERLSETNRCADGADG